MYFIYCLDAPNTYFGPDRVFLDEEGGATFLEPITDCEDYLPFSHKKDHEVADLPPSLYLAIDQFIIARAIRDLRGRTGKQCSMMVNVSRFVAVQRSVRDCSSVYEKKMREAVKANYAMPDTASERNAFMHKLRQAFVEGYSRCGFKWDRVKAELFGVFDNLCLYEANSRSDEAWTTRNVKRTAMA